MAQIAQDQAVQLQNMLAAEHVRRIAWTPPVPIDPDSVAQALRADGAREWQVALVAEPLARALSAPPPAAAEAPGR